MSTINLVPVFNGKIQNNSLQLCNARELHSFLKSKYDYSNWINKRITDYGFVENEDYIIVTTRTQGRPRKDYHITLDMGKELAMVERNEKGRLIRKYFIECERTLKKQTQRPTYSPPDFHLVAKNHSIQNGRYLVVIKNGQAFIKPIKTGQLWTPTNTAF